MSVELEERVGSAVAALECIPSGPALAAALSGLDPAKLSGTECVLLLRARYRQSNHDRGALLELVDEVHRRGLAEATDRGADPDQAYEFAADEVRAALVLTRRAAEDLCGLAADLAHRLPAVAGELKAGRLDQPRARVFSEWTGGLSDEHARAVCAALLPVAGSLTTGQLIDKLKRHAIALDPC